MYEKKRGPESFFYWFIRELDARRARGPEAAESPLLWPKEEVREECRAWERLFIRAAPFAAAMPKARVSTGGVESGLIQFDSVQCFGSMRLSLSALLAPLDKHCCAQALARDTVGQAFRSSPRQATNLPHNHLAVAFLCTVRAVAMLLPVFMRCEWLSILDRCLLILVVPALFLLVDAELLNVCWTSTAAALPHTRAVVLLLPADVASFSGGSLLR